MMKKLKLTLIILGIIFSIRSEIVNAQDFILLDYSDRKITLKLLNGIESGSYSLNDEYVNQINIWSRENGQLSFTGDVVYPSWYAAIELTPNIPFQKGDELMITINGLESYSSGTYPSKSFTITIPTFLGNPMTDFMEMPTGITLPSDALDYSYQLSTADFDKNSLRDFVFRYHNAYGNPTNILVYLQQTDGTYTLDTYTNSDSHSSFKGTPDVNNDGYPDIVVTHNFPSKVHVRLNNGDGTFGTPAYYTVTNYSGGVQFGDLDNDGDIDMYGSSGNASLSQNTISIFKNNGDGTFQSQITISTSLYNGGLKAGDLDNDGDLDLVYTSSNNFGNGSN